MSAALSLIVCWFPTAMPAGPSIGDPENISWAKFTDVLSTSRREGDKDGPCFAAARFKPEPDGKHVRRVGANVLARTAVVLDIEPSKKTGKVPPSPDDAAALVRKAGWAGVIYTSHNHTAAAPRYRTVLLLSAEIDPALPVVESVADRLGLAGVTDTSKAGAESLFYLPSANYGDLDQHQTLVIDGRPLNAGGLGKAAGRLQLIFYTCVPRCSSKYLILLCVDDNSQ